MKTDKVTTIASMGGYGGKFINDTNTHTPSAPYDFVAIQVLADAEITTVGNIENFSSVTVLAGTVIYGIFTSITLSSGSVVAYIGG